MLINTPSSTSMLLFFDTLNHLYLGYLLWITNPTISSQLKSGTLMVNPHNRKIMKNYSKSFAGVHDCGYNSILQLLFVRCGSSPDPNHFLISSCPILSLYLTFPKPSSILTACQMCDRISSTGLVKSSSNNTSKSWQDPGKAFISTSSAIIKMYFLHS